MIESRIERDREILQRRMGEDRRKAADACVKALREQRSQHERRQGDAERRITARLVSWKARYDACLYGL